MPHLVVGTAGHIDHGKTALVKALTGIDTDRLQEEKARGITIDIGFASLTLDPDTTLGFVDVPGHERFVKNMLAGVGGIDLVLLVVAADESVMPQTREHLEICSLLGIAHGIAVLTKIDAADPEIADLSEIELHDLVRGTFLDGAPIIRVSARTGEGLPLLIETLRHSLPRVTPKDAAGVFRLPIDRAFTMKGFGTVVSGTLVSGRVQRDEEVEILPGRVRARVRGIQVHNASVEAACAGQRTALNLQRLDLTDVQRGMVATAPGVFAPTTRLDVHLELLRSAPAPIEGRRRIRFHIGTAEVMGYVRLIGQDRLEPGHAAPAQVRLERPTFAVPGDRFIVRQYSPMTTIGGGEILDAHPARHRRSSGAARAWLDRLTRGTLQDRILAIAEAAGMSTVNVPALVGRFGVPPDRAAVVVRALIADAAVVPVADHPLTVAAAAAFSQLTADIVTEVGAFHAREPLLPGIQREDLKGRVAPAASAALFRAALEWLAARSRITVAGEIVRLADRTITLADADAQVRHALMERYRALGLQAAPTDDVIAALGVERRAARKLVQLLVTERELVRINEAVVVDRQALDRMIADLRARRARSPRLSVGDFKEMTGLSRKFAVPLLEYLDAQRITRRAGEEREIL